MKLSTAMLSEADLDDARVDLHTTDASGEPVGISLRGQDISRFRDTLTKKDGLRAAWKRNTMCPECEQPVVAQRDGCVLTIDGKSRVVHKKPCFVRAYMKLNPTLCTRVAREGFV